MSKLRLDLGSLQVQSFATAVPLGARGTVRGAESDQSALEPIPTYQGCETGSCMGTLEELCQTYFTCPSPKSPCDSGYPSRCDLVCG